MYCTTLYGEYDVVHFNKNPELKWRPRKERNSLALLLLPLLLNEFKLNYSSDQVNAEKMNVGVQHLRVMLLLQMPPSLY